MRLPIVSRADGFTLVRLRLRRIDERWRELEGIDAERLLDDLPDFRRERARQRLRARVVENVRLPLVRIR